MKYSPRFSYTFTPGSATLNLSANAGFSISGLLAVIDVTATAVIYAAGQTGLGYSAFSAGTLTLQASMSGLLSTDVLVFFYDDGAVASTTAGDVASGTADSGNPVKIGGVAASAAPTPVAAGQRVNGWSDLFGRSVVSDLDPEWGLAGGMTSYRDKLVAQRYTVLADSIADGLATFWTTTTANGGTVSVVAGEGLIQSNTTATGSAQISSTAPAYFPGQVHWCIAAARFGDTGVVGNTRRIGAVTVSGTTPQDGYYYELADTALNAVTVKAGVATAVAVASWSRAAVAPFTLDANYHLFEIRWTANRADFLVDSVLRHTVSGSSTPITTTLNFPMTIQSVSSSGTTNRLIAVRNIGLGRFGTPDAVQLAAGTNEVGRVRLTDGTNTLSLMNTAPLGTEYAPPVRNIASDFLASGTITATDAVLGAPSGTGTFITGTATAGSTVVIGPLAGGDSSWNLQLTGTFGGGTCYFEGSLDSTTGVDGNWIAVNGRQTGVVNTNLSNGTTVAGMYRGNTSGLKYVRARMVGATAPSVAVLWRISDGVGAVFLNAGLPTGSDVIGGVTQSGTWNIGTITTLPALAAGSAAIGSVIALGGVADGVTDAGSAVKTGGVARTANPTAVTTGQRVSAAFDKLGKQIAVAAIRELKSRQRTNIAASTAETTIVTAGAAGVFNDLYGLVVTNNGAATMSVTIRDVAAGTPVAVFQVPATDTRGLMLGADSGLSQATAASAWTATCTPNATSADITALYVSNL